ncbi:MAG: hypothetical protein AAB215_03660 [Planctomycetota bacterium]
MSSIQNGTQVLTLVRTLSLVLALGASAALADISTDKDRLLADMTAASDGSIPAERAKPYLDAVRAAILERLSPEQKTALESSLEKSTAETDPSREALRVFQTALKEVSFQDEQLRGMVSAIRGSLQKARVLPPPTETVMNDSPNIPEKKGPGIAVLQQPLPQPDPLKPADQQFGGGSKASSKGGDERHQVDYSKYYKRGFNGADGWGWPASSVGGGGGVVRGHWRGVNGMTPLNGKWSNPGSAQRRSTHSAMYNRAVRNQGRVTNKSMRGVHVNVRGAVKVGKARAPRGGKR